MKILYFNYSKFGSGSIIHTFQFFRAFKKLSPHAVLFSPRSQESQLESGRTGIRIGLNPFREIRFFTAAFFRHLLDEFREIRKHEPEVVILRRDRYLSAVVLCRLFNIPIILEVNGPFLEEQFRPKENRLRGFGFWKQLEIQMLRLARHIIVVSEPLRQYYIDGGIPPENITTIPNGADVVKFNPGTDGGKIRRQYGLEGKLVFGFMGTFAAWHGIDFLVGTLSEFLNQDSWNQKAVLFLIGTAKYNFRLPDMNSLGTVVTGHVAYEEVPDYLSAVDIFIAPYPRIEPFYFSPLKIMEAMAAGKPVLASAQGQIRELIQDGVNGFLFPPGDKQTFLKKLKWLGENKEMREKLGANARRTIAEKYTWEKNAEKVLNLCTRFQRAKRNAH